MFGSIRLSALSRLNRLTFVCPSSLQGLSSSCHFSTGAEWSIVVLGFAKYSKKSKEIQVHS